MIVWLSTGSRHSLMRCVIKNDRLQLNKDPTPKRWCTSLVYFLCKNPLFKIFQPWNLINNSKIRTLGCSSFDKKYSNFPVQTFILCSVVVFDLYLSLLFALFVELHFQPMFIFMLCQLLWNNVRVTMRSTLHWTPQYEQKKMQFFKRTKINSKWEFFASCSPQLLSVSFTTIICHHICKHIEQWQCTKLYCFTV